MRCMNFAPPGANSDHPTLRCPGPSRVIVADDVSPNTRVECPKVPTELRLREPLIDRGGRALPVAKVAPY